MKSLVKFVGFKVTKNEQLALHKAAQINESSISHFIRKIIRKELRNLGLLKDTFSR